MELRPVRQNGRLSLRTQPMIPEKRRSILPGRVLLGRILNTSSEFWMNLQVACDLYGAQANLTRAA